MNTIRPLLVGAFLLCGSVTSADQDQAVEPPVALQKAVQWRSAQRLLTARIEFSVRPGDRASHVPKGARRRFFTSRCAGSDSIMIDQGDAEGVVVLGRDGSPAPSRGHRPRYYLRQGGELWEHTERAAGAYVHNVQDDDDPFGVIDLRNCGLNPTKPFADLNELEQRFARLGYPPLKYTETTQEGLHVVTGVSGQSKYRWWIDPAKDWNVVRTAILRDDAIFAEARFALARFDGIWFPQRVEYFPGPAGEVEASLVLEVFAAEFNCPEHPTTFTPADIGVEPGMSVTYVDPENPRLLYWDGQTTVSIEEFAERQERGEVEEGATLKRELARLHEENELRHAAARARTAAPTSAPATTQPADLWRTYESEWEAYTRRFIAHFALEDDQTTRALAILKDCQQQAASRLVRLRPRIRAHEERVAALRAAGRPLSAEVTASLAAHRKSLVGPIDEILESRLKPRLDRLPTRKQRARAGPFEPRPHPAGTTTKPAHRQ